MGLTQRAVIAVKDEGIGIDPAKMDVIFSKFERGVSDRHYGGLGLGLYISRQIIDALGGDIQVHSEMGEGSTFTVLLPLQSAPQDSAQVLTRVPTA